MLTDVSVEAQLAVHDRLTDPIWRRNILLLAMETLLTQEKAEAAESLIVRLDKAYVYQGYRALLRYYARQGDLENYRRVLKRSDRRRARNELARIEQTFVAAYSKARGVEAALKAVDGTQPLLVQKALEAQVGRLPYAELHRWAEQALAGEDLAYVEVHIAALAHLVEQGASIVDLVAPLLTYIRDIEPRKRISGSNYTVRQQALWRLGCLLLDAGLTDQVRRVLKYMSRTSSRRDLAKRLKAVASEGDADEV